MYQKKNDGKILTKIFGSKKNDDGKKIDEHFWIEKKMVKFFKIEKFHNFSKIKKIENFQNFRKFSKNFKHFDEFFIFPFFYGDPVLSTVNISA